MIDYSDHNVVVAAINGVVDINEHLMKERDGLVAKCSQLEKERDSAIADFTIYVKHMEDGRKAFSCEFCNEENCDGCKHCSNFEWRGVQEYNDALDNSTLRSENGWRGG